METFSSGTLQSSMSMTGSSKTQSSEASGVAAAKERDYTKDNSTSPVDLECMIQAERIAKILEETVYKSKLALCLPFLIREYSALSTILSKGHMCDLIDVFEQYDNPLYSQTLLNIEALEDIKAGNMSLKNRLNPEIGQLITIINSYAELKPIVNEMYHEMKAKYLAEEGDTVNQSLEYLITLEKFREQMIHQMETTAADELAAKFKTRRLEATNADLIEKIQESSEAIKTEAANFEELIKDKTRVIEKLKCDVAALNYEASIKLKKKILDSERQMVLATRSHTVKNEMLKEEEVECREAYEQLLRQHLLEEKNQRARRFKVETQLLGWIQKYDIEMGDKQVELDDLTKLLEEELELTEKLEERLAEQDKEYVPLMAEREEEYHGEMTEKMNAFMLEHAARVIQVAWRNVLSNRAEKKKLKKLLKKKQAADEAAQRAAELQAKKEEAAAKKAAKAAKKK